MQTNQEIEAFVTKVMKGLISTETGGLIGTQQLDAFIETVVDQSGFLSEITNITGIISEIDLDSLGIGSGIIRAGVEGVAPEDLVGLNLGKRTLAPKELLAPVALTYHWLRKAIGSNGQLNPDQANAAEQAVTRNIAKVFSSDLVRLFFNGDKDSQNPFIKSIDGIIKKAVADAKVKKNNYQMNDDLRDVFEKMLDDLPNEYQDDTDKLRFYASKKTVRKYRKLLSGRQTALGDILSQKKEPVYFEDILVQPVFAVPDDRIILTKAENLAVGFGTTMEFDRDKDILARKILLVLSCWNDFNYRLSEQMVMYSRVAQA